MKKTKVIFFEVEEWEKPYLIHLLKKFKITITNEKLTEENVSKYSDAEIISIFTYSNINSRVISSLPKLKFIATRSTGYDHIDIRQCKKKKILISNVPSYGSNTVAEYTFSLILALTRKVHLALEKTRRGNFSLDGLLGSDLSGRTIGIIGGGKIGYHVAKIAQGFDMNVLVFDKIKKNKELNYVSLKNLLKKSDIITLHAPLNKSTYHLINKQNLKIMKKGAILINTARGPLINTCDLINALNTKHISGAALDVLEEEPLIKEEHQLISNNFDKATLSVILENHILMNKENVIITPHSAFYSKEALHKIEETTIQNIQGFLNKKPKNLIK